MKQQLDSKTIRGFHVAQVFPDSHKHKQSLSFSRNGERLVVCDHENLTVFDCNSLEQMCQVHMHLYRPESVCFTPQADRLLHSTTKVSAVRGLRARDKLVPIWNLLQLDFGIRYLNLSTRQYMRLFAGHEQAIRDLRFQPGSEHCFMSAGWDMKLMLWDLRAPCPCQQLNELQCPLGDVDPSGRVIATCKGPKCIEIYDVRMLKANPCQRFRYQVDSPAKWTQLQFAPDGRSLLVTTDYSCCFSVDAFDGSILQAYMGWSNSRHLPLQACYTPDSKFVMAGADRGCVHVWRAGSGKTVEVLKYNSAMPVRCLQFSPQKLMFVSCDISTHFWQPRAVEEQ
ncbi:hypothetical protein KR222_011615, partial [Zaprionus bogoriensis]